MKDDSDQDKAGGSEALLTFGDATFRVAFHLPEETLLAGGLAPLTLSLVALSGTLRQWVVGDRMTGRPAGLSFKAELDGTSIPQVYPSASNRSW